jgi:hypothetical protein
MLTARFPGASTPGFVVIPMAEFVGNRLHVQQNGAHHDLVISGERPTEPGAAHDLPASLAVKRVVVRFDDAYLAEFALRRVARALAPSPWRWVWRSLGAFFAVSLLMPAPQPARTAQPSAAQLMNRGAQPAPQYRAAPTPSAAPVAPVTAVPQQAAPRAPVDDRADPFGVPR